MERRVFRQVAIAVRDDHTELDIVQDAMFKLVDRGSDRPAAELSPFDREWDRLKHRHRQRWPEVAEPYPDIAPERQQRLQTRMREWKQLTLKKREQARKCYQRVRELPPEEREALHESWGEHRNLPEDQRQDLRKRHHHKNHRN